MKEKNTIGHRKTRIQTVAPADAKFKAKTIDSK